MRVVLEVDPEDLYRVVGIMRTYFKAKVEKIVGVDKCLAVFALKSYILPEEIGEVLRILKINGLSQNIVFIEVV